MAQAWIHSRDGKMPFVLCTMRRPFGERVHLWCRAGTSAEDFVWARHLVAAACWAREVRVLRSERFVHLVALDVIRRADNQFAGQDASLAAGAEVARQPWVGEGVLETRYRADQSVKGVEDYHPGAVGVGSIC